MGYGAYPSGPAYGAPPPPMGSYMGGGGYGGGGPPLSMSAPPPGTAGSVQVAPPKTSYPAPPYMM
jgi:hypothetical protein